MMKYGNIAVVLSLIATVVFSLILSNLYFEEKISFVQSLSLMITFFVVIMGTYVVSQSENWGKPMPARYLDRGEYKVFSPEIKSSKPGTKTLILPLKKDDNGSEVIVVFPEDLYNEYFVGKRIIIH